MVKNKYMRTKLLLSMSTVILISSCSVDADMDRSVILTNKDLSSLDQSFYNLIMELSNKMKAYPGELETDQNNPDVILGSTYPSDFVSVGEGLIGVVDLGLSEQWCISNLGPNFVERKPVLTFAEFFQKEVPQTPNVDMKSIITMSEYIKMGDSYFSDLYKEYEKKCNIYLEEYEKAKDSYYSYLMKEKYNYINSSSDWFSWGENFNKTSFKDNDEPYKNAPTEYAGNSSYDPSTQLWGNNWKTPSKKQMEELFGKCKVEKLSFNWIDGPVSRYINCFKLTGPSGKSMLIYPNGYQESTWYGTYGFLRASGECFLLTSTKADMGNQCFVGNIGKNGQANAKVVVNTSHFGYNVRPIYTK